VLFEMLTGHPAFEGHTSTDIFAAVLKTDPRWQRLPADTPEAIRRLLRRCLQKDVKLRLRDVGDTRLDIEDARSELLSPTPSVRRVHRKARLVWLSAVSAVLLALLAMRVWPSGGTSQALEARFEITTPPTREPDSLAISPDGKTLVFAATFEERTRLWLRSITRLRHGLSPALMARECRSGRQITGRSGSPPTQGSGGSTSTEGRSER
jgi:serine/threonine protein kinase